MNKTITEEIIYGDDKMKRIERLLLIIIILLLWSNLKPLIPNAEADSVQAVRITAVGNSSVYNGVLPVMIK